MENNTIIQENSDFLFIYDATLSNPNGDPDQENKPRMDYDTNTNLVTDTRVKRSIRDYLKASGNEIFVDMEGDTKVSPDSKLKAVINRILADETSVDSFFGESPYKEVFVKIISEKKATDPIFKAIQDKKNLELNSFILEQLVKQQFIDIRMFGSAFAIGGFSKAYTGPIQLNWGYSLHKVDLVESNTIVTTMNDDSSTFGKDYRVHYSMLAFNGTINKHVAKSTGLTIADRTLFRQMIWESISAMPTRSKLNQYAKLYVEIVYNEGFSNGHFGDLRNLVSTKPDEIIRKVEDVNVDLSKLLKIIRENQGEGKAIKEVIFKNQLTDDKI
ncbi:CRISPR-associated protein [Flectobacillus major]|uniref:CRISPR-associated protein n=1 Tax=Flectobacillus major TaxID=103 RepID=UPI000421E272|nr:type I CRISPR-associated protein Cas7 [Flectobacillus major]